MTKTPLLASLAATALLLLQAGAVALEPREIPQPPGGVAVTPAPATPLAQAQARLAFVLPEKLAQSDAAAIASPASLAVALSALAPGADAAMRTAIATTLGFRDPAKADLDAVALAAVQVDGPGRMAALLILPKEPPAALRASLDAARIPYAVEDMTRPDAVAKVNAAVGESTGGRITDLLDSPLGRPGVVALGALHFKDRWKEPFDPAATAPAPFRGVAGKPTDVPMMRLPAGERAYRSEGRFVGVELPFSDPRYGLVVVTTRDRPARAREFGPVSGWLSGEGFAPRRGDLSLPRMSLSTRSELLATLDGMGLAPARRSPGSLSGFGDVGTIGKVVQRVVVDVTEEGAEAAAATAALTGRSMDLTPSLSMVVDKPFVFALRERGGLVLASGYVGRAGDLGRPR